MSRTRPALFDGEFLRRLEHLEIVSRKIFTGKLRGEKRSRRKGFSQEFADYRDYVHGDDLRFLDWNVYGRLDKLFLRLFHEEEDLHVHVLLDASRSMDYGQPDKFDYARRLAASVGYVALSNLNPLTVRVLRDGEAKTLPSLRGRKNVWRLLDFLEEQEPSGGTGLEAGLRRFALERPRRGVAVIISDFLLREGPGPALKWLQAAGMESHALHVLSPQELQPDLAGDLKLMDMEDADLVEVSMTGTLLKSYARTLGAFRTSLAKECARRRISYTFSSTGVPFEDLVLLYLRRAGLVR